MAGPWLPIQESESVMGEVYGDSDSVLGSVYETPATEKLEPKLPDSVRKPFPAPLIDS